MANEKKYQVHIIFDEPATTDAFDSGGHKRTASALASAIDQIAADRKRDGAIGLEGKWGSGKSSVIEFAKEDLATGNDQKSDFRLFTFDLWSHQTDDFRRAFLEAFVSWAEGNEFLSEDIVKITRDTIRDRVKTVTTTNSKRYNILGLFFILIAPLLPLAYLWLSPFVANIAEGKLPEPFGHPISTFAWIGLGVLYAVFLVRFILVIGGYCWNKIKNKDTKSNNTGFIKKCKNLFFNWKAIWNNLIKGIEKSGSKTVTLFSRDAERETTTQNIRETDPTTIEFHSIFRELLGKVQKGKRRVIFVLDNIDRLALENVPTAWSQVRALFSNELPGKKVENAHVTAIVPYDKDYILKSFKLGNGSGDQNIEEDFLDKTFIQILRVSPPIGTDWKQFLYDCLNEVFAEKPKEDTSFRLFRLLEHNFQSRSLHPTPRRIIKFVNDVATIWSQWKGLISIDSIALYVLHKSQIEHDPNALKNASLVSDRYLNIAHAKEWQRDFAALVFNVDPKIANQVFLDGEVIRLLTSDNIEELKNIAKLKAFPQILSTVLAERANEWAEESAYDLEDVATNLDKISLNSQVQLDAWRAMNRALTHIKNMDIADLSALQEEGVPDHGFIKILKNQEPDQVMPVARSLAKIITKSSQPSSGKDFAEGEAYESGEDWLSAISAVANAVEGTLTLEERTEFLKNSSLIKNNEFYLGVTRACANEPSISFSDFDVAAIPKPLLLKVLAEYIDPAPVEFYEIIDELNKDFLQETKYRSQFLEPIATKLRTSPSLEEHERQALLKSFALLHFHSETSTIAKTQLDNLVTDGTLLWHGNDAATSQDFESSAICIWLIIQQTKNTSAPPQIAQHPSLGPLAAANAWYTSKLVEAEVQPEEVTVLANYAAEFKQFSAWVDLALSNPTANGLFQNVLRTLVEEEKYSDLDVVKMALEYDVFKSIVGDELAQKFLVKYAEWGQYYKDTFTKEVSLKLPDELVQDISELDEDIKTREILTILDKVLKSLPYEEWTEALTRENDALRLLVARQKTSKLIIPAKSFKPALLDYALSILSGKILPSSYADNWPEILEALPRGTRTKIPEEILRKLSSVSVTPQGAENFLGTFGDVAQKIPLKENADAALDQFLIKLMEASGNAPKSYIRNHADEVKACYDAATTNSQDAFKEFLSSFDETDDDSGKEWAQEVQKICGIRQRKTTGADDATE